MWAYLSTNHGRSVCAFGLTDSQATVFCVNKFIKKGIQPIGPSGSSLGDEPCLLAQDMSPVEAHKEFSYIQKSQTNIVDSPFGIQAHQGGMSTSSASESSIWDSCLDAEHDTTKRLINGRRGSSYLEDRVSEEDLPVYGRGDHSQDDVTSISAQEKAILAMRAIKLLMLFVPILLFGGVALVIARGLEPKPCASKKGPSSMISKASRKKKDAASVIKTWACKKLLHGCR